MGLGREESCELVLGGHAMAAGEGVIARAVPAKLRCLLSRRIVS